MSESMEQRNMWWPATEPVIAAYGPQRIIGMSYVGKNEHGEIPELWGKTFIPRMQELGCDGDPGIAVGICRCVPGKTDGTFEYIAGCTVSATTVIPTGMIEVTIPQEQYLIIPVPTLSQIGDAWNYTRNWFGEHPEWDAYCGPDGCDCVKHPSFELYPPEFNGEGPLFLYMPLKSK